MREKGLWVSAVAVVLAAGQDGAAQRRGGGGAVGARGGAVAGPYGGGGYGGRVGGTAVGPYGGTRSAGAGSGSYTTQRGTTVDYAGAGRGGVTPGGVQYGRGAGGVQVTTPGGATATRVGTAGGVAGPGGNAVGTRAGVTAGTGPGGSFSSAYRGGVAVGPRGAAAGGTRVGTAVGPAGNVVGGATRAGVAAGPYGAAAGVRMATAARGPYGTYYASSAALRTTGTAVRGNFGYYGAFTPGWYARYPGAWFAAGWTASRVWSAPAWGTVAAYGGYPAAPIYYDYGSNVVITGDTVVVDGKSEVPAAAYAQYAADVAATGQPPAGQPAAPPAGDDWQPLGVFALVGEGEANSTNIFQLAVNKQGLVRGNYYNALTDTTEPVAGAVDKATQRAAWTVADRKSPVYEAGIANLTRDETPVLVHYGTDKSRQMTLVRVQQPDGPPAAAGK